MNRGSSAAGEQSPAAINSFNEAPIHESGKSPTGPWAAARARGFNEAPIHESGKWTTSTSA